MWTVRLSKPLPGLRAEVFEAETSDDAYAIADLIHAKWPGAETCIAEAGTFKDVLDAPGTRKSVSLLDLQRL